MNRRDERSVGELLLDADFTTRQVLMDVTGQDAPAMLRTWGEVVQSASELWATLPEPVRGATSPIDGVTMRRPEPMSQGMPPPPARPCAGTYRRCCERKLIALYFPQRSEPSSCGS